MGGLRKLGQSVGWLWRRLNDLSTLAWLWQIGATLIGISLAVFQGLPLAMWFIFGLAAFCLALIGHILWHERPKERSVAVADGPIRDRIGALSAAAYMIFGEWDRSVEDLTAIDQINFTVGSLKQMVQDAIDGHLTIWVKKQRHGGNHIDPGKQYWEEHHLDYTPAPYGTMSAIPNSGGRFGQTFDPLVRKSDIERLYGPK